MNNYFWTYSSQWKLSNLNLFRFILGPSFLLTVHYYSIFPYHLLSMLNLPWSVFQSATGHILWKGVENRFHVLGLPLKNSPHLIAWCQKMNFCLTCILCMSQQLHQIEWIGFHEISRVCLKWSLELLATEAICNSCWEWLPTELAEPGEQKRPGSLPVERNTRD